MLHRITVSELAHRIQQGEVSSREATQACLDQIGRVDGQVKAYLNYDAADALAQADAADQLRVVARWCAWQIATASASAASARFSCAAGSRRRTIMPTWSFSAWP